MSYIDDNKLYLSATQFFRFAMPPKTLFCDGGIIAGPVSAVTHTGTGTGTVVVDLQSNAWDDYQVIVKCISGGELNVDGVANANPPPAFAVSLDNGVTYGQTITPTTPKGYTIATTNSFIDVVVGGFRVLFTNGTPTPSFVANDTYRFTTSVSPDIVAALSFASRFADGYLVNTYNLPLLAWSDDLRMMVAKMARWELLGKRGMHADQTMQSYEPKEALEWLVKVARGDLQPIITETPAPYLFPFAIEPSRAYRNDWRS
jgi:hypothetical protein